MRQRGRKSASKAKIEGFSGVGHDRPEPPEDFSEEKRQIWESAVNSKPGGFFKAEHIPMLENYCQHVVQARFLARKAEKLMLEEADDSEIRSVRIAFDAESKAVIAHQRAMRMSPRSQYGDRTAFRASERAGDGPRPWMDS